MWEGTEWHVATPKSSWGSFFIIQHQPGFILLSVRKFSPLFALSVACHDLWMEHNEVFEMNNLRLILQPSSFSRWDFRVCVCVFVSVHSLFLMSFSSLRMREDSCSGVGALKEREGPPSPPEGGVGSRCLKSSSMLLCSLRFRPYKQIHRGKYSLHKTKKSYTGQVENANLKVHPKMKKSLSTPPQANGKSCSPQNNSGACLAFS